MDFAGEHKDTKLIKTKAHRSKKAHQTLDGLPHSAFWNGLTKPIP
jgi:hypothetical protein